MDNYTTFPHFLKEEGGEYHFVVSPWISLMIDERVKLTYYDAIRNRSYTRTITSVLEYRMARGEWSGWRYHPIFIRVTLD